jgi:hypothetical protein
MAMEYYRNLSGASGVRAYEITQTQITVQFTSGSVYVYNYVSTGVNNIEYMKLLAVSGRGLNAFIKKRVNKNFARRLR